MENPRSTESRDRAHRPEYRPSIHIWGAASEPPQQDLHALEASVVPRRYSTLELIRNLLSGQFRLAWVSNCLHLDVLATPFRGTDAAKQAEWQVVVGGIMREQTSTQLVDDLNRRDKGLRRLTQDFAVLARAELIKLPICCFYETNKTEMLKRLFSSNSALGGLAVSLSHNCRSTRGLITIRYMLLINQPWNQGSDSLDPYSTRHPATFANPRWAPFIMTCPTGPLAHHAIVVVTFWPDYTLV